MPFAVYLGDEAGRMRMVVFDLDAHDGTPQSVGRVWADADALLAVLDEAGLDYYVSSSGPSGGVHVWVPVSGEEGLDEALAKRIGAAAKKTLASLDTSCLHANGLVRPPGSPHRAGGRAELIHPAHPADALSVVDTENNTPEAFEGLAVLLGADEVGAGEDAQDAAAAAGRIDPVAQRLRGRRVPMPDAVRLLLDTPPDGDASAHLARILPRLALARWGEAEVRTLVEQEAGAPGLEHLRTRRTAGGRRPRSAAEQDRLLAAQWQRAVRFAAGLPERADGTGARDWSAVCSLVEALLARVADPGYWTEQAGLADRLVAQYIGLQALLSGQLDLDLDVRRVALGAGVGRSTAHRALHRLIADGRLVRVEEGSGRSAARYRLIHPDHWPTPESPQVTRGGTQGTPPQGRTPPGSGEQAPAPVPRSRDDLLQVLTGRLARAAHDVWAVSGHPGAPRGLGRAAEAVHDALLSLQNQGPYGVDTVTAIAQRTGMAPARVRARIDALVRHGLAAPGPSPRAVAARDALDAAARRLGTAGITDDRRRRYDAEREAYAAWLAEVERLRAPATLARRRIRPAYPRTPDGRPDHAAARARARAA